MNLSMVTKQDDKEGIVCRRRRRRRTLTASITGHPCLWSLVMMVSMLSLQTLDAHDFIMLGQIDDSSELSLSAGKRRKIKSKKKTSNGSKGGKSATYYSSPKAKSPKGTTEVSTGKSYKQQHYAPPTCRPFEYHYATPQPVLMLTKVSKPPTISPQTSHPNTVPQPTLINIPTASSPNNTGNEICNMSITKRINDILNIIIPMSGFDNVMTTNTASPQYQAAQWIIHIDEARLCPNDYAVIQQRYALAVFYYSTSLLPWKNCGADPKTSPCSSDTVISSNQRSSTSTVVDLSSVIDNVIALMDASVTAADSQRWLTSSHVCSWYGVKCNGQLEATHIWLDSNNLSGTIPFELSVITNSLSSLSLLHNSLYGSLPPSLGDNSNMVEFHVAFNNFSGTIPDTYSNWSILKSFNVEGNSFQGFLFSNKNALFDASYRSMENLILSDNDFQGTISPALGAFTNLTRLLVDKNSFTGTMPLSICGLQKLVQLEADCAGMPPQIVCSCCTLCYNSNDGSIMLPTFAPTSPIMMPIYNPPSAQRPKTPTAPTAGSGGNNTNINNNSTDSNTAKCNMTSIEREKEIRENIRQSVPETPNGEEALDWILNVDKMYLCPFDKTLHQRYALAVLYYVMNGDEWTQCSNNVSLPCDGDETPLNINNNFTMPNRWLSPTFECYWYGVSCTFSNANSYGFVQEIDLHNNNLAHQIPYEIGLLNNLKVLLLQLNENINGTLPTAIGKLEMLERLDVDTNQIGGVLPSELFLLERLEILALSNNQFSGTLSTEIGNLSNLTWVQLFGNKDLSGPIPKQIGSLLNLTVLTVQHTNFTGYMPDAVCALRETETLVNGSIVSGGGMLSTLQADCASPPYPPRLQCDCCTGCFSESSTNITGSRTTGLQGDEFSRVEGNSADYSLLQLYRDVIKVNRSPREWQVVGVLNESRVL